MKILAPASSHTELICSAVVALTCHAAAFGLLPDGRTVPPQVELAAHRQALDVTLIPCTPMPREKVEAPLREKAPVPVRQERIAAARKVARPEPERMRESAIAPERVAVREQLRVPKDLPVREDALRPEERLLVLKKEGDTPNEGITRRPSARIDSSRLTYPRFAREAGMEGRVVLRVHVTSRGEALEVQLAESCGHSLLDRSAMRQVREKVAFTPGLSGGSPVDGWLEVPIRFILLEGAAAAEIEGQSP